MEKEKYLLDTQAQEFQELLKKISTCCQKRQDYEAGKFSLPYAEAQCLLVISYLQPTPLKEITKELDISKGRVTRLVQNLIQRNLVVLSSDSKDGRLKKCFLTPQGEKYVKQIAHFRHELHKTILSKLSPKERTELLKHLQKLSSIMENIRKNLN